MITEPRYLKELKDKFYYNPETLKIIGAGIKPVHNLGQLKLDRDIQEMFNSLNHSTV